VLPGLLQVEFRLAPQPQERRWQEHQQQVSEPLRVPPVRLQVESRLALQLQAPLQMEFHQRER